jgi:hypothetical protein
MMIYLFVQTYIHVQYVCSIVIWIKAIHVEIPVKPLYSVTNIKFSINGLGWTSLYWNRHDVRALFRVLLLFQICFIVTAIRALFWAKYNFRFMACWGFLYTLVREESSCEGYTE